MVQKATQALVPSCDIRRIIDAAALPGLVPPHIWWSMSITIAYSSQRREIMRTYWRFWRMRLWKLHAAMVAAIALVICLVLYRGLPPTFAAAFVVAVVAIAPVLIFPLIPLIRFKPERRTLTIDGHGIDTAIGHRSGCVAWTDIASIRDEAGNILMQRYNGNAFVIPPRAFGNEQERAAFLRFANAEWKGAAGEPVLSEIQRPTLSAGR